MATGNRKRCEFCGELFRPHPRLGERQRACFEVACKDRRKAEAKAAWRAAHPDFCVGRAAKHRAYRAAKKATREELETELTTSAAAGAVSGGVLLAREQDAIPAQIVGGSRVIAALLGAEGERDAILTQGRVLVGLIAKLGGVAPERDSIGVRVATLDNLARCFLERAAVAAPTPLVVG